MKSQTIPGRFFLNSELNDSLVQQGLSSNVVAEILNYNRDATSSIGYSTADQVSDKTERRNILV